MKNLKLFTLNCLAILISYSLNAQTTTFNYTGGMQTYVVPAGIHELTIDMYGAKGGDGGLGTKIGGYGGRVQTILTVTPGQTLNIFVGGIGQDGNCVSSSPFPGGYNGGGDGYYCGASGGGASDIRIGGTALNNRVVIAGGGGGGGDDYPTGDKGGDGGDLIGANGEYGVDPNASSTGKGGSQVVGGIGGTNPSPTIDDGLPGTLGIGGRSSTTYAGGGGGGGYYGGGGGAAAGGGGGSSYTDPVLTTGTIHTQGENGGNGLIIITEECVQTSSTISPSTCTSYTSPSGNYTWTTSNTYMDTIPNAGGCDSLITINLTITGPSNGTDVQVACDSYTWPLNSTTYTSSTTTPTHTIVGGAASGCDSIVTLNLTINNTANGTDVVTACDSYLWIDNNTYTANNTTATHTITGGAYTGCDSIVTLNLTINTVDNTTSTQGNDSISANATGVTYQWLDCDNSFAIISGATNQLFVASANGNYAVQVTQNGCTDTSACVQVTGVGINELSKSITSVYPNPTTGNITIQLEKTETNITFQVRNVMGQLIETKTYPSTNKIVLNLKGDKGVYFIEIQSEDGDKTTLKVFKQ